MKFHIRTLGCKINWLDSARLTAALQSAGHVSVDSEADADLVFVNTCTVTAEADRKSRAQVNAAGRIAGQVAVMGCGPRVDRARWQMQVAGNAEVFDDEEMLLRRFGVDPSTLHFPVGSRTRLPIAIQKGCDNNCTFCITKIARGRHANVPAQEILAQVCQAEELGIKEVVLTGINLAAWGCEDSNRPEQARLHELLERILCETSIPRIRLSSLGPQFLHQGFFDVFSDRRICDHLHLSVQSGSPTVLERMVRGHGVGEVLRIAEGGRRVRPDVALAADIIVGFPGETNQEFEETMELIETVAFAKLHVFPYSTREGTPAATMPGQLDGAVKKERAARLREAGRHLRERFVASELGKRHDVLVETNQQGLTTNYIRVRLSDAREGEIHRVVLERAHLM